MAHPPTTPARLGFVTFPEAPTNEEMLAAVLVTRDADGNVKTYVRTYPGYNEPDADIVALLAQSASITNLPEEATAS